MMDKIYEELDDARAEIGRLRAENREKAELSESLRRAHNKQLHKIQEISLELEKQRQESNEKTHEASVARQMLENLKCNLNEKECIITRLSSANNKLRVDLTEKIRKNEVENRELVFKLEEENAKNMNNEQKIQGLEEAIERLKGLFSVSEKKRAEAKEMGKASKEMRHRDDILLKLEEENRKLEDQLKRKREQFEHLKQAHEKVREQLQAKSKEWEKEKSTLLDEIDTLQDNLDSQTRISKGLQSQLKMCTQALAHEESRIKRLEVQLLESKTSFDNLSTEFEEAKSKLESLSGQRDKEIATLRDLLTTKETFYKEMEYKVGRLEQENQELVLSLKEFQGAQIQEARTSSMSKFRNKPKGLEQIHKECSIKFKAKEAEWRSETQKLREELNCCRSEQESSGELIKKLRMELEGCHSLIMQLMLQTEESSVMLLVFKSEFMEAYLKRGDEKAYNNPKDMESEKDLSLLKQQLEMKNIALTKALKDVEVEREEVESLSKRMVESLNQQLSLTKELDMTKEMLMESSACQTHVKEQVVQMKGDLNRVCDALDKANEELAQKYCEVNEAEFELQIWKSIAERLKANVEENYQLRKEVEASLLEQVSVEVILKQEKEILAHMLEEKDGKIDNLQQKVVSLDQELQLREEGITQVLEEKDRRIDDLQQKLVPLDQMLKMRETGTGRDASTESPMVVDEGRNGLEKEIEWWEKEWVSKELERAIFAQLETERISEREKKSLHQLVDEKDHRIVDLQQHVRSLEQEFENSTSSFSSQLINMQTETDLLHKAWDKFTTTVILMELEIQEKNLLIGELENDSSNLQHKLKLQGNTLSSSEVEWEAKKIENQELTCLYHTEFRNLHNSIKNLDNEKRSLSLAKERLLGIIGELSDMIFKLNSEDMQLMGTLGRIVHNLDDNGTRKYSQGDELFDPVKENLIIPSSPITKKVEKLPLITPPLPSTDDRSPLRALNS